MLRLTARILVLSLVCGIAATAEAADPAWLDEWREATVALGTVNENSFKVAGTGVIFGTEGQSAVLVTAKHVLFDPTKNWNPDALRLRFSWFEDRSVADYHGIEVPLRKDGKALWTAHPTADLAALPLNVSMADAGRPLRVMSSRIVATASDIFEGAPVVALGFPGIVGRARSTRVLVRGGTIAWVDPKNPATEPLLVDSQVFPGNSGGPVIRMPVTMGRMGGQHIGNAVFVGLISGVTGITIQTPTTTIAQFTGVGVIEPAARVLELIRQVTKQP